ncbi:MAG: hypothetical protein GF344_01515 [Chitinivibrionales bacterium]|nr:hypothetical protein [Chitinivibrionales bacterium]
MGAILVSGIHRSGSTWLGNMISLANTVVYIHEPFQVGISFKYGRGPLNYWYEYLHAESDAEQQEQMLIFINYLKNVNYFDFRDLKTRQPEKLIRTLNNIWKKMIAKSNGKFRYLYKDPIALFSIEWLINNIPDLKVVISIRHPAAFVNSIKSLGWGLDFNHIKRQQSLVNRYLRKYAKEIELIAGNRKATIIDEGILIWNLIHERIKQYQQQYPRWCYIKYENIASNPIPGFKSIYEYLDLEFTPKIENRIKFYTTHRSSKGQLIRDSKNVVSAWKKNLSVDEIDAIATGTKALAKHFGYSFV